MAAPPPKSPLSPVLLAADCAVILLYALGGSVASLFTSGEYLAAGPAFLVSWQDVADIALAFDRAAALALGWAVGSAAAGASAADWAGLDHAQAPLGVPARVLPAWLLAWPLACALEAALAGPVLRWSAAAGAPASLSVPLDLQAVLMEGVGLLVVLTLWRRWLLQRYNF